MKINEKKLLSLLSPISIAVLLYFLDIPVNYILLGLSFFYLGYSGYIITKERYFRASDDMKKAWDFVQDWWWNFRRERLSTFDAKASTRYYGDDKYIAFVVSRSEDAIEEKKYMDLVIIVKTNPLDIVVWDDNPSSNVLEDPFTALSTVFYGSPSPSIKPDLEPILRRPLFDRKKKEKPKVKEKYDVYEIGGDFGEEE